MLNRRLFLLSSLASLGLLDRTGSAAAAKWGKHLSSQPSGPHLLYRQIWSPVGAIASVVALDKVRCCLIDENAMLTVMDMSRAKKESQDTAIIGTLMLEGQAKAFCLAAKYASGRAFALVHQETELDESVYSILSIQISLPAAPQIISRTILNNYQECNFLGAAEDLVCVGGISTSGENLIATYATGKGNHPDLSRLAVLSTDGPIKALNLQDRTLAVLHGRESTKLSLIDLHNPAEPQLIQKFDLDDNYTSLCRVKDFVFLAGGSANPNLIQVVLCGGKVPRFLKPTVVRSLSTFIAMAAQNDHLLVLGDNTNLERVLMPYRIEKTGFLRSQSPVKLSADKHASGFVALLSMGTGTAFVASVRSGVAMLSLTGQQWSVKNRYSIPRLPAAGLATWANFVVVAGSDLKLYDIAQPEKPSLVSSAALTSPVRAVAGAGSFVLCLTKDKLALRKIDDLETVVATIDMSGQHMCFDQIEQMAYLLKQEAGKTVLRQIKIYSDSMVPKSTFELNAGYSRAVAYGGNMVIGSLNDLALYSVAQDGQQDFQLIGSVHLDNLAFRDFALGTEAIFATAVDPNLRGSLLAFSKEKDQLKVLSTTDIPHDGTAIACSGKTVATVGSAADGKNLITLIDVSSADSPKLIASLPSLESASSVAIKDKLAIVAGRGLEIVSL